MLHKGHGQFQQHMSYAIQDREVTQGLTKAFLWMKSTLHMRKAAVTRWLLYLCPLPQIKVTWIAASLYAAVNIKVVCHSFSSAQYKAR